MWGNHRNETELESQVAGFISLVGAIHEQMAPTTRRDSASFEQGAPRWSIARLAWRKGSD
jgi:hypothetical protein